MEKILVIGESPVEIDQLKKATKELHIPLEQVEFRLGYKEAHRYDYSQLKKNHTYSDVLVGPMPHKVRKCEGGSRGTSFIAMAEATPDLFPHIIRLMSGGALKITRHSFQEGLKATFLYQKLSGATL